MRIVGGKPVFSGDVIAIDGMDADYVSKCRYCYNRDLKKYGE